jgi:hypothetical protein
MELAAFFGRTPELGHQELVAVAPTLPFQWSTQSIPGVATLLKPVEGRYGHDFSMTGFQDAAFRDAIVTLQRRLGGTVRLAWGEYMDDPTSLVAYCHDVTVKLLHERSGKWNIGVSIWGKGPQAYKFAAQLKRSFTDGHTIRTITSQGPQLNSAQLLHNKLPYLTFGQGVELVLVHSSKGWWVGVTLTSQDIADYTKRDFGVPKPDPVSGMLPPKLAQTMINLAVGAENAAVYDPFCGNGRIVLEATLMGLPAYGSDIVPEKVLATQLNLQWLEREYGLQAVPDGVWQADATQPSTHTIPTPWHLVAEPYLGPPLRQPLAKTAEKEWAQSLLPLYEAFFTTWKAAPKVIRPESFLMVFPRAKAEASKEVSIYELFVDRLHKMGYSSKVLFCYDRPGAYVRRDLVKLMFHT